MKVSIITLFPEVFTPYLSTSILKRAQDKKIFQFEIVNLRDFGQGLHQVVDGRPYGGGAGMVLRADILAKAWHSIPKNGKTRTILMSASGILYKHSSAQSLSQLDHLIVICGHYEGIDQRFIDLYVDEEISIGDYVLTGGEIPAMVVIDSVVRLLPQVLKKEEATVNESFSEALGGLLEHPQYTRPEVFEGQKVPQVLVSGNHQQIDQWRETQSLEKTKKFRPELLKRV